MQDKLILMRKKTNTTQEKLAELLGISKKQYSYKENGKAKFNGDEMFVIASYFGVLVDDIFLPTIHQNGENAKKEE